MSTRRSLIFLAVVVVLIAGAWGVRALVVEPPAIFDDTAAISRVDPSFVAPAELQRLIGVYEARIAEVTTPSDYLILGNLYLEAARTTGDLSRYGAAESLFTTAQELQPQGLAPRIGLARTQYSLHQFEEARTTTEEILADAPGRPDVLALLADIQTALGDLDAAQETLTTISGQGIESPALDIRLAQHAWFQGDHDLAMEMAEKAVDGVGTWVPAAQSWYESFASQMAFRTGDLLRADELALEAFVHDPETFLSKVTLGRSSAAENPNKAAELYAEATEIIPDPEYLAALGDLQSLAGDDAAAMRNWDTVTAIADLARAQGAVYDRQVARFYADHDLRADEAVELARAELEARQDPEAHDTLAWALLTSGDAAGARLESDLALAGGFRSAPALYHAGMISKALGEDDRALSELTEALALNPVFDPFQVPIAEVALQEVGG